MFLRGVSPGLENNVLVFIRSQLAFTTCCFANTVQPRFCLVQAWPIWCLLVGPHMASFVFAVMLNKLGIPCAAFKYTLSIFKICMHYFYLKGRAIERERKKERKIDSSSSPKCLEKPEII